MSTLPHFQSRLSLFQAMAKKVEGDWLVTLLAEELQDVIAAWEASSVSQPIAPSAPVVKPSSAPLNPARTAPVAIVEPESGAKALVREYVRKCQQEKTPINPLQIEKSLKIDYGLARRLVNEVMAENNGRLGSYTNTPSLSPGQEAGLSALVAAVNAVEDEDDPFPEEPPLPKISAPPQAKAETPRKRREPAAPLEERHCAKCGAVLVQRENERTGNFKVRKYCGPECAGGRFGRPMPDPVLAIEP